MKIFFFQPDNQPALARGLLMLLKRNKYTVKCSLHVYRGFTHQKKTFSCVLPSLAEAIIGMCVCCDKAKKKHFLTIKYLATLPAVYGHSAVCQLVVLRPWMFLRSWYEMVEQRQSRICICPTFSHPPFKSHKQTLKNLLKAFRVSSQIRFARHKNSEIDVQSQSQGLKLEAWSAQQWHFRTIENESTKKNS